MVSSMIMLLQTLVVSMLILVWGAVGSWYLVVLKLPTILSRRAG